MTCEAERCNHQAAYEVTGPGMSMKLCGCCAERATEVGRAAGLRVEVHTTNGVKPCAMPVSQLDIQALSAGDLVQLRDAVNDEIEERAAGRKAGQA